MITGSLGYIGSVLAKHLLKNIEDAHLILLDRMDFESNKDFFYSLVRNPRVSFFKTDVRNEALMTALIKDCSAVVNLAALVGEPICRQKPEETILVNEKAAKMVADICTRKGVRNIFLSTCSNYGQSPNAAATEESPLYPESLYAQTKVLAEQHILENCPSTTILRCATAYGISPRTRFDLIINEWMVDAMNKGEISIFSPEVHRPLVHVADIAEAIYLVLESGGRGQSRIFNTGSNEQNFTKGQIAKMVADSMGVPVTIDTSRTDPRDYVVDFSRIHRELNFKCKYSVEDGIREIKEAIDKKEIQTHDIVNNRNVIITKR